MIADTEARAIHTEDASAFAAHCDRVKLLCDHDPRRAPECWAAYAGLKAAGHVFITAPLELDGGLCWYSFPHPRFVALYETLRLRARLDLPAGETA